MPGLKKHTNAIHSCQGVRGFDHIELFVGNVRHAAHYYCTVWGFHPVAFRPAGTGQAESTSIVLRQGNLVLLLTGAATASSPVAEHLHRHGEGVAKIGLAVDDVEALYDTAVARGVTPVNKPITTHDGDGQITVAELKAVDGFTHIFVDRSAYSGAFSPGFQTLPIREIPDPLIDELDHVAIAVEAGTLDAWADFYQRVFGFELAHKEDILTEQTGMNSRVLQHPSGACKFPLVEPVLGRRRSQVQEFLDVHHGPGVQHLAVRVADIIGVVSRLREKGVQFLRTPAPYYDDLENRVGSLEGTLARLRELGILVDRDEWGRLLQVFALPCHDRPTVFFEIIERQGARGFGGGNIRALFESMEREQVARGTT